ncbi:uncharacterized protein LOC141899273 isoform X2 [Tubulanus polymorphus]|uniref:uncharacterized protein LOC141899273 isoform X2 n=1 Tax=Tubulanus polymorphus TaxID=672921 RepID=UPI003DA47E27
MSCNHNDTYSFSTEYMVGAQLDQKQDFVRSKTSSRSTAGASTTSSSANSSKKSCLSLTPLIVDFQRLLKGQNKAKDKKETDFDATNGVIPGVSNRELLHAVIGLYDVSLSEMTPDVLYNTVCEKLARTIILVRDIQDVVSELEKKREKASSVNGSEKDNNFEKQQENAETSRVNEENSEKVNGKMINGETNEKESGETEDEEKNEEENDDNGDEDEDIYVDEDEDKPATFACVYSDTEDEEDSESDEDDDDDDDDEDDFSLGINTFLSMVKERRKERLNHTGKYESKHVHIENRIVGCITYDKKFCRGQERVIHLTLIAVRKRFQGWGIGKYLLQQVKDPMVVGQYDAVVVHADNSAIEFFQKYGFNDDMVLNNKWTEFAEQFTNCTLMCFLPQFHSHSLLGKTTNELDLASMDKELKKWRDKTLEAYQAQVSCITRYKNEILHLRKLVTQQEKDILKLKAEKLNAEQDKYELEKDFLKFRLSLTRNSLSGSNDCLYSVEKDDSSQTEQLIRDLERQCGIKQDCEQEKKMEHKDSFFSEAVDIPPELSDLNVIEKTRYMVYPKDNQEPYDHMVDAQDFFRVTEDFKASMKSDKSVTQSCEVKSINKATLTPGVVERYETKKRLLNQPSMLARLYYCGSLENPKRLSEILKYGFTERDFTHGEYGRGLHFSLFPSKAANFSAHHISTKNEREIAPK